ncbi:DUF2442 domain-containing protein [Thiohalocapsa sp. ML1]|jgi:hypothetical protein|uniref:DUF2442 domain-containing protein n=1 Tax=Thiohalocapsa sp. ML1 TaxID=1431688 RepID=UPI000731F209|nr:DUF2442 domain-containing protein [Thiohalocapsa sp. ML1]
MILHTIDVAPLPGHRLGLRFNNCESGIVDLSDELDGEMFEPLKDPDLFATAHHHPVMRTVAWSTGADLAPEFLLGLLHRQRERAA